MNFRTVIRLTIAFLVIFSSQPAMAEDFLLPYDGAYQSKPGFMEVIFSDADSMYLYSTAPNKVGDIYNAVFPACALKTARNCIQSVEYKVGDGPWSSGQLSDYVETGLDGQVDGRDQKGNTFKINNFPEDTKSGTPAGGKASTWLLEGAPHAGGSAYLVSATFNVSTHFTVQLVPIQWGEATQWSYEGNTITTRKLSTFSFPQNIQYRVSIHLGVVTQRVNKWFTGRLTDPLIDISGDLLTVTAKPGYSSAAATDYFSCGSSVITEAEKKRILMGSGCSYRQISPQYDSYAFPAFKYFEPYLHQWKYDTAWTLDSQDSTGTSTPSTYEIERQCNVQGIGGVSVTNALVMQNQMPTWNPAAQELVYNIASTHLGLSDVPNIGTLELALNEKLAKCLWGASTLSSSKAKVSVTYENGERNTSTSVSNLRNGWMYLKVDNFTFSTPKIALSVVVPAAAKVKAVSPIKCSNGKKTLSVSGKSPICPLGYKRM